MILIDNFKNVLKNKYADFSGKATRSEFWYFALASFIISFIFGIIDGIIFGKEGGIIGPLYTLAVLVPSLAVTVRRLHDTNRSGWWILIGLIPFIGWIWLLVYMVSPSTSSSTASVSSAPAPSPASNPAPSTTAESTQAPASEASENNNPTV